MNNIKFYKHSVFDNYAASKDGDIINVKKGTVINKNKNNCGYLTFTIYNKKLQKQISILQHRFVFEVFNGKIPPHLEIHHINSKRDDNRIKNLELLTHQQNIEKSKNKQIISTNIKTGEEKKFKSMKNAGKELDISKSQISDICRKYKYCKSATSKKDGCIYTFKYL